MLKVPNVPFKHRFLDFNQVTFWNDQDAENEFKVTYEPFKHRFHQSRILGWLRGRKSFQILETT